jgi:hypothetical protein
MTYVAFGTAQLFGLSPPAESRTLLGAAWDAGVRRFDTAPSYGGGRSEAELGEFLRDRDTGRDVELVSTKVGLAPAPGAALGGLRPVVVGVAKRALPGAVTRRMRRSVEASGRFDVEVVRTSVEQSLRRLDGRVDRLLLHEVQASDITDDLLELLTRFVSTGDAGQVGVATRNERTLPALERGGSLMTVAHVASGPLHDPPVLPAHVRTRVAHGLLGEGGSHLRRMNERLAGDPALAERWRAATDGTPWTGDDGLPRAMLGRAASLDVTDVIVSTTRAGRVAQSTVDAGRTRPLPDDVLGALDAIADSARAGVIDVRR